MTARTPAQARTRALSRALALAVALAMLAAPASALAADFNPLYIISDETWRASYSMSVADIQAFLEAQPGVLKSYSCAEGGPNGMHSGVVKPASQIIAEASEYWGVNPKLVIATLEKEQSLITGVYHAGTYNGPYVSPWPAGAIHGTGYHLTNAMGCGCYPGSKDTHPGFGDQVWTGAQKLASPPPAGLATTSPYYWYPGKTIMCSGGTIAVTPLNQPTWNLYTYTPYYPQSRVWNIYVQFFGDPLASPAKRPVYRFYNTRTGTHFYTASETERWGVASGKAGPSYRFEGAGYSVNTSNTANSAPLYRFYNRRTATHFYTASESEKASVQQNLAGTFTFEGPAYLVSLDPAGSPVFRFYNRRTGTHFYTVSEAERNEVIARYGYIYTYEGAAFFLAP